jgi:energy-coupling factor transport system permease protein
VAVTAAGKDGRPAVDRAPRRRRSARSGFTLLRTLPHDSAVHRLWAGTKLVSVAVLSVVLSLRPYWTVIGVTAGAVLAAAIVARVPRGAVPRPPRWFWFGVALGAVLTLVAGGAPDVDVAGARVGLGDLELYGRFFVFGVVLVAASAVVGWTTPLAEVAPALACLGRPLRWLRLPVDEWAMAVALCVRSLPLLMDEVRTLVAARRLRPGPGHGRPWRAVLAEPVDLLTAAMAAALRRSAELAQALDSRGGPRVVPAGASPSRRDAAALLVVAAVAAAGLVVPG